MWCWLLLQSWVAPCWMKKGLGKALDGVWRLQLWPDNQIWETRSDGGRTRFVCSTGYGSLPRGWKFSSCSGSKWKCQKERQRQVMEWKKEESRQCLRSEKMVIMEGPTGPSFLWMAIKVESIEESMSMPIIAFDVPWYTSQDITQILCAAAPHHAWLSVNTASVECCSLCTSAALALFTCRVDILLIKLVGHLHLYVILYYWHVQSSLIMSGLSKLMLSGGNPQLLADAPTQPIPICGLMGCQDHHHSPGLA